MTPMPQSIVVGGDFDTGRQSSVLDRLADELDCYIQVAEVHNGKRPDSIRGSNLTIWMPNIPNDEDKDYPVKDQGSVLICSKVIHGDRTEADAVTRIFAMHGNAVIAIYKDTKPFRFKLIDALGNTWIDTTDIEMLAQSISNFYFWSAGQKRRSLSKYPFEGNPHHLDIDRSELHVPQRFIDLNTRLADKVEAGMGPRYFGNFSTRCMKLFPSCRTPHAFLFSPRNTDKRRLSTEDFVLVTPPYYYWDRKPSVDTPVQIEIFRRYPDINFMIHGHAYVDGVGDLKAKTTEHYYPCGDLREVPEITAIFDTGIRVVNLKNHGFILATSDLDMMEVLIDTLPFRQKDILL